MHFLNIFYKPLQNSCCDNIHSHRIILDLIHNIHDAAAACEIHLLKFHSLAEATGKHL